MARGIPFVASGALHFPDQAWSDAPPAAGRGPIAIGSRRWFEWLAAETSTSFAFRSFDAPFTATKEGRARGGAYWYAYRKQGGRRRKVYLGRAENLTVERLRDVSVQLAQPGQVRSQPEGGAGQADAAGPAQVEQLVGRDRELAALRGRLRACLAGSGGLVLIGGAAGIGKTALAETLAREAATRGATVLVGRCYDLSATPPYGPWADILDALPGPDGLPVLPALLNERSNHGLAGQAARFTAVLTAFGHVASRRPCLLVLDDVHWADPASLDLLHFLGRQLAPLRVLLLAIYRADELNRAHPLVGLLPALVREAAPLRIDLARLDEADVRHLARERYPLGAADEDRLVAYLETRAEGNPFFVQELLRALEQEGTLRPGDHQWRLGDLSEVQLPPLLRQVIDRRLRQLPSEAQEALAVAAVIGQAVPLALWAEVAGLSELELLAIVEQLVAARLLVEAADGATVHFAHGLVRRALYEGLLARHGPASRRVWQRRVGEALAAARSDPDAVAYHFRQAGDPRALEWLIEAGRLAEQALDWRGAAERFAAALPLLDRAEAGPRERALLRYRLALLGGYGRATEAVRILDEVTRLATEAGDRQLASLAEFHSGYLESSAGRVAPGLARMEAAFSALDGSPDLEPGAVGAGRLDSLLARPSDPDPRGMLAAWLALVGRLRDADRLGARWVTLGEAAGDVPDDGCRSAGMQRAYALAYTGRVEAARRELARLRTVYRMNGGQFWVALMAVDELRWVALPYAADDLAWRRHLTSAIDEELRLAGGIFDALPVRWMRLPLMVLEGEWAEARALADAAWASGSGAQHLAVPLLGVLAYEQGDLDLAHTLVREHLPSGPATPPGASFFMTAVALQRLAARLALDAGDLPLARAWLEANDRWLDWSGVTLGRVESQLGWAELHHAAADPVLADVAARRALAHAGEPRQPLAQLAAHRLLGQLAMEAGSFDPAASHLERALGLASACAAPFERALTLLASAELALAQGRSAAALALLDEARAIGAPLAAARLLGRAAELAEHCRLRPADLSDRPAGLSAREVEVLRLIARGRNNTQIAAALCISLPTAKKHVAHILAKINAGNRTAAAAFAHRAGLS